MKKYILVLVIILINNNISYSQTNNTSTIFNENFKEALKHWKTHLDYIKEHQSTIFNNPNLKLISYNLLDKEGDLNAQDFLNMPIDSLQLIPVSVFDDKSKKEMLQDNYNVKSTIDLVLFSEMSIKKQYNIIAQKFYFISNYIFDKQTKLLKLTWKYKKREFHTYCVVFNNKIIYDIILMNTSIIHGSRSRTK
ncbi:hypothetical protein QVZ41_06300 [Wenyingzhuangia sp. chi5]|uniref:Uncharacterized protein n=1 Tax=Wenyingzhuangia gilva TaxID=3057677 RepID=A0ABT8VR60_9FLAO|nr:hypothetical protein [Wenyingzhuangia sp. chi5]MDO3694455.1 hypothetical protein [Wenyingzhuangia sp. chi5]